MRRVEEAGPTGRAVSLSLQRGQVKQGQDCLSKPSAALSHLLPTLAIHPGPRGDPVSCSQTDWLWLPSALQQTHSSLFQGQASLLNSYPHPPDVLALTHQGSDPPLSMFFGCSHSCPKHRHSYRARLSMFLHCPWLVPGLCLTHVSPNHSLLNSELDQKHLSDAHGGLCCQPEPAALVSHLPQAVRGGVGN